MTNSFTNAMNYPYPGSLSDRHRAEIACSELKRELFYLWTFIAQQDMWEEALDFLDEYSNLQVPFELFPDDIPF